MFTVTVRASSFILAHISNMLVTRALGAGITTSTVPRPMAEPLAHKAALRDRHIGPDTALKVACLYSCGKSRGVEGKN